MGQARYEVNRESIEKAGRNIYPELSAQLLSQFELIARIHLGVTLQHDTT